jgi:hypothetical protein
MFAVFFRPTQAWGGLRERAQWWWPILVMTLVVAGQTLLVYDRAIIPDQVARLEQMVDEGTMQAADLERTEAAMSQPVMKWIGIGFGSLAQFVIYLLVALLVWFACSFLLGAKMSFRHGLEVSAWSSLVTLPTHILVTALAWSRESMQGLHTGLGMLLPESEDPGKLMTALGVVLDAIGPLAIWYLVVAILGAAALSGAPRKDVARVLVIIYVVVTLLSAAGAAVLMPGA